MSGVFVIASATWRSVFYHLAKRRMQTGTAQDRSPHKNHRYLRIIGPEFLIFRYFLNILSLGSCFQGTKMRNSGGFQFKLLRISLWRERSYGDLLWIPVHGCPGLKTRAGETGTIRNCHCKNLLICHCELLLWSNLNSWNAIKAGGNRTNSRPREAEGVKCLRTSHAADVQTV